MLLDALIWIAYIAVFVWLARKGQGHDALTSGRVGFGIQAFAYVATYISAVALVGFGGLAYAYGLQMLLVAAGNVWLGTWIVYRFLAWPTRVCQRNLQARTPTQLLAKGHKSPFLGKALALLFAVFLGVYASAVIKGAALLLAQILPLPLWSLIWLVALLVGFAVFVGGLRGVLYTEAMQGLVMLLGICMLVWAVFSKVGGPIQGIADLAQLAPTAQANEGFLALSSGEQGWFIISLVVVTSIAVWAQPQMIQRHFALNSAKQVNKITPLAMLVLTVLVGGAYFVASLSRLILPEVASPDDVMPTLVKMLLPNVGLQIFVLSRPRFPRPRPSFISPSRPLPRICRGARPRAPCGCWASPSACCCPGAAPRSRASSSPCSAPPAGASWAPLFWWPTWPWCASASAAPWLPG